MHDRALHVDVPCAARSGPAVPVQDPLLHVDAPCAAPPGDEIFFAIDISFAIGSSLGTADSAIGSADGILITAIAASDAARPAWNSAIGSVSASSTPAIGMLAAVMSVDVPGAPVDGRVAGEGGARKYRDSTPRASSWKAMSIGRASGSTMFGRIVPNHLGRTRSGVAAIALPPKSDEVTSTRLAQVLFRSFFRWVATLSPSRWQKPLAKRQKQDQPIALLDGPVDGEQYAVAKGNPHKGSGSRARRHNSTRTRGQRGPKWDTIRHETPVSAGVSTGLGRLASTRGPFLS